MITIRYSCRCGLDDVEVQVPAREGPHVNISWWMTEVVVKALADDHKRRSPKCDSPSIKEIKIPTQGVEFIGQQIE